MVFRAFLPVFLRRLTAQTSAQVPERVYVRRLIRAGVDWNGDTFRKRPWRRGLLAASVLFARA